MSIPFAHTFEVAHTVEILDRFASPAVVDRGLRAAGLSRRMLDGEAGFLPYAAETALLESVARALGERHLGALVGQAWDYSRYQGYARYVLGAPNLGDALERGARALPFQHPGSAITVRQNGDRLVLGFITGLGAVVGHLHVESGAIFVMGQALRRFLGPNWRPEWIEITGEKRSDAASLEELAGAPVRRGAEAPALAVRIADLTAPNPDRPAPEAAVTFDDLPSLMGVAPPETTQDAVLHVLQMQFALGDFSQDRIASRLSVGPRTLQRLLMVEGTSFRAVKARFIEKRARALLAGSDLGIDDVARSLGYREPNSFRRAFRDWTGFSPHAYRAQANKDKE